MKVMELDITGMAHIAKVNGLNGIGDPVDYSVCVHASCACVGSRFVVVNDMHHFEQLSRWHIISHRVTYIHGIKGGLKRQTLKQVQSRTKVKNVLCCKCICLTVQLTH